MTSVLASVGTGRLAYLCYIQHKHWEYCRATRRKGRLFPAAEVIWFAPGITADLSPPPSGSLPSCTKAHFTPSIPTPRKIPLYVLLSSPDPLLAKKGQQYSPHCASPWKYRLVEGEKGTSMIWPMILFCYTVAPTLHLQHCKGFAPT